jgi:hypothetical protein
VGSATSLTGRSWLAGPRAAASGTHTGRGRAEGVVTRTRTRARRGARPWPGRRATGRGGPGAGSRCWPSLTRACLPWNGARTWTWNWPTTCLCLAALCWRLLRLAERHLRNPRCRRAAVILAARGLDRLPRAGRYLWLDFVLRRGSWTVGGLRACRSAVGRRNRVRWRRRGRPSVGSTPAAVRWRGCLSSRRLACERFLEPADDRRLNCR